MEEDNVAPNVGDYFFVREPVEQTILRKKEKALTLEALPILKQLVRHFEERIRFYDSVSAIPKEVKTDPEKFLICFNANELAKKCLIEEKEYVESLLDANAKNL